MDQQQRFIDIEILKRYRTATDEQKKLLDKIYGKDTFEKPMDEFLIIYGFMMDHFKKNNDQIDFECTVSYPIQHGDQIINLEFRISKDAKGTNHLNSGSKMPGAYTDIFKHIRNLIK